MKHDILRACFEACIVVSGEDFFFTDSGDILAFNQTAFWQEECESR